METLLQDLRFALRVYAKNKSFTLIAVLALSIGIGSNIAVFTVVNALLLSPLPYPESERLVQVGRLLKEGPAYTMSYARFRFYEQNNRTFESLAAYDVAGSSLSVIVGETPELLQSSRVSANFFRVLGVSPLLGRAPTPEEDRPGAAPVAVISHRTWSRLFGNDPAVVGRSVRMSGENYTVIGVMPADFRFGTDPEAWVPLRKSEDWSERANAFLVIGRLRPGTAIETAQQDTGTLLKNLKEAQPATVSEDEVSTLTTPYRQRVIGDTRGPLLILAGVVACVLLIACANVANLLVVRAIGRRREVAVRIALGVSRTRMIRQLLTESLLLGIVSGAVGLLLAISALGVLELWLPLKLPKVAQLNIDWRVLLFAVAASGLTSIVFGLVPALQLAKMNPAQTLRELSGASSGRGIRRLQAGLVGVEIALSTALLLTAGLLLISFQRLRNLELGYEPAGVLIIQTSLAGPEFAATEPVMIRVRRVIERLKTMPEVLHVATVTRPPTEPSLLLPFELSSSAPGGEELAASWIAVTPEFFEAMSIRLRAGRVFTDRDSHGSAPVVVVNEMFVRKFLGGVNPLGQQLLIGREMGENFADKRREIVGVVADTRGKILQDAPSPAIFVPTAQVPDRITAFLNQLVPLSWVIQVSGDPSALSGRIRKDVFAADPSLVASNPRPLTEMLSALTAQQKMYATLVGFFAAVALFLGAIGLHGVLAHSAAARKHEIGIRMALGADRRRVVWLMIRYSLMLLVPGLVAGVILSLALRYVLASYLFGVSATSITVYAAVIMLLSVIALAATIGPALRATKVDPTAVLRQ